MTHLGFLKISRRLKLLELAPGFIGCFIFSFCILFCLFLLDYIIVNSLHGKSLFWTWFKSNGSSSESEIVGVLESGGEGCDISEGNWVWDASYPLIDIKISCSWMRAFGVLRIEGLIISIQSGVGNPKVAPCRDSTHLVRINGIRISTHLDFEVLSQYPRMNKIDLLNIIEEKMVTLLFVLLRGPNAGPAPLRRQDCSHWWLPGVPVSWNELRYALFLKRHISHGNNLTSRPNS